MDKTGYIMGLYIYTYNNSKKKVMILRGNILDGLGGRKEREKCFNYLNN